MHAAGEQFLLTCTFWAFIGAILLNVVYVFHIQIEDAIDEFCATLRKLLR